MVFREDILRKTPNRHPNALTACVGVGCGIINAIVLIDCVPSEIVIRNTSRSIVDQIIHRNLTVLSTLTSSSLISGKPSTCHFESRREFLLESVRSQLLILYCIAQYDVKILFNLMLTTCLDCFSNNCIAYVILSSDNPKFNNIASSLHQLSQITQHQLPHKTESL